MVTRIDKYLNDISMYVVWVKVTRKIKKQKGLEMMLETLLKTEFKPFMSIIFLTVSFQDITETGYLELKHYRYALVQKDDLKPRYKKEMYNFFERPRKPNLEDHSKDDLTAKKYYNMVDRKEIGRCISSRQNLIKNYLNKLVALEILEKNITEGKTPLYRINRKKRDEIDIIIRKYQLKRWISAKIDDSEDNSFRILEKKLYKILFS